MKRKLPTRRLIILVFAAGLIALQFAAEAAGPTSTLYLTAGDQHRNWRVLPGTTLGISSPQTETAMGGEYAIAVLGGVIRTAGNGQFGAPALGSTYDLNYNYVGPRLANPLNFILDGATDGAFNYGVNWQTKQVYRCNLDWSSPTFLFNATSIVGSALGITYEPTSNSLWIGDGGHIDRYSMAGTLLSSIATPQSQNLALAYDRADGTLWAMSGFNTGIFQQYSLSGFLLQTINISAGDNIIGGEFTFVPEPGSVSLAGAGCLALLWRRRPRRQARA